MKRMFWAVIFAAAAAVIMTAAPAADSGAQLEGVE